MAFGMISADEAAHGPAAGIDGFRMEFQSPLPQGLSLGIAAQLFQQSGTMQERRQEIGREFKGFGIGAERAFGPAVGFELHGGVHGYLVHHGAGCFALVLEKIPAALAEKVASTISIPVIGIGAGVKVDGQVLVYADMLGMTADFSPKFLRRYADLNTIITDAVGSYVSDVKACDFPNEKEQY